MFFLDLRQSLNGLLLAGVAFAGLFQLLVAGGASLGDLACVAVGRTLEVVVAVEVPHNELGVLFAVHCEGHLAAAPLLNQVLLVLLAQKNYVVVERTVLPVPPSGVQVLGRQAGCLQWTRGG